MSLADQPQAPQTLRSLMQQLTVGDADPLSENETWDQMIDRIHVESRIHRISADTFDYFLEVLPPRWMSGSYFAFAEGQDPLQLFWERRHAAGESVEYFTRRLTDEEIDQFCRLTRVPRNYGSF
jgi:hypothetical protein